MSVDERTTRVPPPLTALCTPGSEVTFVTVPSYATRITCCSVGSFTLLATTSTLSSSTDTISRTCNSVGVIGVPSTSTRRTPSRSAAITNRSPAHAGDPGTSSTHSGSRSSATTRVASDAVSAASTCVERWSRDCTRNVSGSPSFHCTETRYG